MQPHHQGLEVLRRRWVVERTFAWIVRTDASSVTTSNLPLLPNCRCHRDPSSGDGHEQRPSQTRF